MQPFLAAGQLRAGDQLLDVQQFRQPGTVLVSLEPLHPGGLDRVVPGSSCVANAYTSSHEAMSQPGVGAGRRLALHAVDAVGVVHAMLLRIQAVLMPFKALVFAGGH